MTATSDTSPHFISVKGAAQRLGMSIDDVYELVENGSLAFFQKARGAKIHILSTDVDKWAIEAASAKKKLA